MALVWDLADSTPKHKLGKQEGGLSSVAYSPDGKRLATAGDNIEIWDLQSARSVARGVGHTANIHAVMFSPDGT